MLAPEGQAGGHGVTAEFGEQAGVMRRHAVEHVADVDAGNGARRAFDFLLVGGGEGDHRTVIAILDARGEDADHTLMPGFVEQAEAERILRVSGFRFRFAELAPASSVSACSCISFSMSRRSRLR